MEIWFNSVYRKLLPLLPKKELRKALKPYREEYDKLIRSNPRLLDEEEFIDWW